jgi:hypothetical protein
VNDLTRDVLNDDRPIPLRRAAVPDADADIPTGADSESHRATRIDREPVGAPVEAAPPPVRMAATRARPGVPEPPGSHPLTGLRGFRLEPVVVERPYSGRHDLARFLIEFALVMAFVYALIVAFVVLVAHVRGTPA